MDPGAGSVSADGEELEPDADTIARRRAIAATLVRLGFISGTVVEDDNPAVDVLAALLPPDADVRICLSCHQFSSDRAYAFGEQSGLFGRPRTSLGVSAYPVRWRTPLPARTELVLCTQDALCWTHSRPRIRGELAIGDDVTLYSVPFAAVLGAAVHDRRKGALVVWIEDGPTLSFDTTPSEVESLCSYIEREAA